MRIETRLRERADVDREQRNWPWRPGVRDWRRHYSGWWRHCGPHALVVAHGRWFPAAPRPGHVARGRLGRCGRNAMRLALADGGLTYVEGFAVVEQYGEIKLLGHSWVVGADGHALEVT